MTNLILARAYQVITKLHNYNANNAFALYLDSSYDTLLN